MAKDKTEQQAGDFELHINDNDAAPEESNDVPAKQEGVIVRAAAVTVKLGLEMAHQLVSAYAQECVATIHGHSYTLELVFVGPIDNGGMVYDFKFVKTKLAELVMRWDHSLVLSMHTDPDYLKAIMRHNEKVNLVDFNPTAEEMACHFYARVKQVLPYLQHVTLHETATGSVTFPPHVGG